MIDKRYIKTRDGRYFPFTQMGSEGAFTIWVDRDLAQNPSGLDLGLGGKVFVPNVWESCDLKNTADQWRSRNTSPVDHCAESTIEQQARDIIDLADIFAMPTFALIGDGPVVDCLKANYSDRIEKLSFRDSSPINIDAQVDDSELVLPS